MTVLPPNNKIKCTIKILEINNFIDWVSVVLLRVEFLSCFVLCVVTFHQGRGSKTLLSENLVDKELREALANVCLLAI